MLTWAVARRWYLHWGFVAPKHTAALALAVQVVKGMTVPICMALVARAITSILQASLRSRQPARLRPAASEVSEIQVYADSTRTIGYLEVRKT